MARSYQVTVGPNKVLLVDKTKGGGPVIRISNPSTNPTSLYVGGDENEVPGPGQTVNTVGTTTGYIIGTGGSETFILQGQEAIYGVTNTNTVTVHVFRSGG